MKRNKIGYIDINGKEIVAPLYDSPKDYIRTKGWLNNIKKVGK